MDAETQYAIRSAQVECERKIDDLRFSLQRDIDDLKRDISRLEERCDSLREEAVGREN